MAPPASWSRMNPRYGAVTIDPARMTGRSVARNPRAAAGKMLLAVATGRPVVTGSFRHPRGRPEPMARS